MLNISKEQSDEITTANMGSYVYAPKVGDIQKRTPETVSKNKKYNFKKVFKKFNEASEEKGTTLDEVFSSILEFYSNKIEDVDELLETSIETTAKYLKLNIKEFEED